MKRRRMNKNSPNWAHSYFPYEGILSEKVLGQEKAVSEVASILAAYKNRPSNADFPAPRIVLIGSPSVGKTFLAEEAVKLLDVPSVHINLASVSPPGYRGFDIGLGLKSLVESVGPSRAEKASAIVLDEADKIIRRGNDEFTKQIEFSLLPVLNGERLLIDADEYGKSATSFSTRNSVIFLMGVFPGINPSVWSDPEKSKKALVKFGFTAELVSRLTHFIYLQNLKKGDLKKLIEREVNTQSVSYRTGEFQPSLSPPELERVVQTAHSSSFGIRSMRANIHRILHQKAVRSSLAAMGAD